jgi:hypothetical protein
MPRSTIHCPNTKIGIGRGLDLLLEVGCLRGSEPVAQPATRMEGSVAGCFVEAKEVRTIRQETDY